MVLGNHSPKLTVTNHETAQSHSLVKQDVSWI